MTLDHLLAVPESKEVLKTPKDVDISKGQRVNLKQPPMAKA